MVATTIGTTTDLVIISDNSTPGSGTWALYLNPQKIVCSMNNQLLYNQAIGEDNSLANSWAASRQMYVFRNCKWVLSGSGGNMEKLKRAYAYWSAEDSRPYLQVLDKNAYNQAKWGDTNGAGVTQWQIKVIDFIERYSDADNHVFDITVQRVTT